MTHMRAGGRGEQGEDMLSRKGEVCEKWAEGVGRELGLGWLQGHRAISRCDETQEDFLEQMEIGLAGWRGW